MKGLIKNTKANLIVFLLFLPFAVGRLKAQTIQTPTIIPPSPTAQTFMRYGEIPVDYSTGVPSIDIPIYSLEGRELKMPISISYHASGIKVNDIASEVGLGWALNCGGMISRTVNGIRDETKSAKTYVTSAQLMDAVRAKAGIWDAPSTSLKGIMDFEYFFNEKFSTSDGNEDAMSDRYFYRLPNGVSGIFTYDYSKMSNDENSVITLPYRPLKIEKYVSGTGNQAQVDGYKITDDNGTVYTFQNYMIDVKRTCSEWYLKEVISANATDTIRFFYKLQIPSYSLHTTSQTYQSAPKNYPSPACHANDASSSVNNSYSIIPGFNTPVLDSIVSSKAVIKFVYGTRSDFTFLLRLSEITVSPRNTPNTIVKKVQFTPRYFGTANEDMRLGLENVVVTAPGDTHPQQYSFAYESQMLPPYPFKMESPKYNEDFWGYYNGSNSDWHIPSDLISNVYDQQAYRGRLDAGDDYLAKACMLKEIKYPTGGKTLFQFERCYANNLYTYKTGDNSGYVGGFRVASITNYSNDNEVANVKTYEYSEPVIKQIKSGYFGYDQSYVERVYTGGTEYPNDFCWAHYSRKMIFSNAVLPLEVAPGMPVMYGQVVEYNGTKANHSGKTVFTYNQPYSPSDYYSNPEHPVEYEAEWFYHPCHYDKGNYVPELQSKTVYSFDGIKYHPLSKDINIYEQLFTKTINTGIKLSRLIRYMEPTYFVFGGCALIQCNLGPVIDEYVQSIVAIDTKAYREASLLTSSKTYTYDPLDENKYVIASTNYTYNEKNLAISEKSTVSSNGETIKTSFKYPGDYAGTTVYDSMVARNMISPLIEQSNNKVIGAGNTFLNSTKTNYGFWNGTAWSSASTNIVVPKTVQTKVLNQADYEDRISYNSYDDKGNVTTVSKINDVKKTYLWGYNKSYPVAEIIGTDYATASSYITQSILDNPPDDATLRNHLNNLRNIPKALVTTYTYKPLIGITSASDVNNRLTSYQYDGSGRLAMVHDQDGNILKRFCYNYAGQQEDCSVPMYTSTQSRTYTKNCSVGGTGSVIYTATATSYISQEDANAKALDDINKNGQDYANTHGYCTYYNDQRGDDFRRSDCDPGYRGTIVPYIVPANTYSSTISKDDANAKAWEDVINNGPYNANAYGSCEPQVATVVAISSAPSYCYQVEFYAPTTGFDVWYEVENGGSSLGTIPCGNYIVNIYATGYGCSGVYRNYMIYYDGNSMSTANSNGYAQFNVPINELIQIFIQ